MNKRVQRRWMLRIGETLAALLLVAAAGCSRSPTEALTLPQPTRLGGIALGDSEEEVRHLYGDDVRRDRHDSSLLVVFRPDSHGSLGIWLDETGRVIKVEARIIGAPWQVAAAARDLYGEPRYQAPLGQWAIWRREDADVIFEASAEPEHMLTGLDGDDLARRTIADSVRGPVVLLVPPGDSPADLSPILAVLRGPGRSGAR